MEGLLFFRVYPSDGFRFILIPDGNPSHEFPVLDENPSSNMNSANMLMSSFNELRTLSGLSIAVYDWDWGGHQGAENGWLSKILCQEKVR